MKRREKLNCPNCGAPIAAEKCPYCGAVIYDFSCIDTKGVNWIKIKHHGRVLMCKAYMLGTEIETTLRHTDYYSDNRPVSYIRNTPNVELSMRFMVIPDDDGVLYRSVEV